MRLAGSLSGLMRGMTWACPLLKPIWAALRSIGMGLLTLRRQGRWRVRQTASCWAPSGALSGTTYPQRRAQSAACSPYGLTWICSATCARQCYFQSWPRRRVSALSSFRAWTYSLFGSSLAVSILESREVSQCVTMACERALIPIDIVKMKSAVSVAWPSRPRANGEGDCAP